MSKNIILPYDPAWRALEWAKAHCPSYITNQGVRANYPAHSPGYIEYFFADERDAVLFALKWS